MIDITNLRKNLILLFFSISIFFSFVKFYYIELRFLYLFLIILIFFEKNFFIKLKQNNIKLSIIFFIFIFIHFLLNNIINFNNESLYSFFSLKVFFQILIISISIFLINYFKEILLSNFKKIFDFFIYIFLISIFIFSLINRGILFDTLYKCDLGFFYYTKFIFYENSHFGIIATAVIFNFIYNLKYYLKNKNLFLLYLFFIFFTFGNYSLSFYLSTLFSVILIFISYKSLDKYRLISLILFIILSNFFMFYGNHIHKFLNKGKENYCISKSAQIRDKYNLNNNLDLFKGQALSSKDKFKDILNKDLIHLSTGVHIYSLYVAKHAFFDNPLGYGIHNYKKFRDKIDKTIKISEGYHPDGIITFEETYMPRLIAPVLNFNLNSGSNNISKIIVEFGIFGILFLLFLLIILFSKKIDNEFKFSLLPLIFSQIFVRGAGYFNSGFLIISIMLMIIMSQKIFNKNEK